MQLTFERDATQAAVARPSDVRALFCYRFCTLGGCETVLRERLARLPELGIDAHALFLEPGDGRSLFAGLEQRVTVDGRPAEIRRLFARLRPNLLVSIDTPEIFAPEYSPAGDLRRVLEVHTTYQDGLRYLSSVGSLGLTAIFVPSEGQRELVRGRLPQGMQLPVEIVPNPLPASFGVRHGLTGHERPMVVWVGRLDAHKNWRGFLETASRVVRHVPESEFWIIGGGQSCEREKSAFWKTARERGLVPHLRWAPRVEHSKMPALYRHVAASGGCLVSTSRQESFGMVALEAMACGCAVVTPDIGGFRDFVIHERTGLRYEADRFDEAARAVTRLLGDSAFRARVSTEGANTAREQFSGEAAAQKLASALRLYSGQSLARAS